MLVRRQTPGDWRSGLREHLQYRDLGLAEATAGRITAQHLRAVGGAGEMGSSWHCHDLHFQFFYVLQGSITLETRQGAKHRLRRGSSGYHPPLYWHCEYGLTADFEAVEITAPDTGATFQGLDAELPRRLSDLDPDRAAVYTWEDGDAYVPDGRGMRARDLGTRGPTSGRIEMRLARPSDGERSGLPYATPAWLMAIEGTLEVSVQDQRPIVLAAGDALCAPAGGEAFLTLGADCLVLEMREPETGRVGPAPGTS